MTLISSISGIRGTIGGKTGTGLTPDDVVRFTAAFGSWIILNEKSARHKVIVGRDGRMSGATISNIVCSTLVALGIDVIDLGLSTTPTVEIAVTGECASGGIIITASHNPKQWNALKFLNSKGEFISKEEGNFILELAAKANYTYAGKTGTVQVYGIKQDEKYDANKIKASLRDHAWFIAFAPIEDPQIAVAVIIEHSKGSPMVARKVLDAYFAGKENG